jgi:pilus assembly protein FimV
MLKRLTIPLLLIMLSSGAQALTLGQIHVHSFINQPLKATIDLQGVKADDLTALKIKLASRSDFKNAGVDWSVQLEGLNFSIIQSNKGPAIRVTSSKAVVEPFLSFVVDARWANGKMIKDFTLLLDPPLYSGKKAAAVDVADAASVTAGKPVQSDAVQPLPQKQSVSAAAPEKKPAVTSPAGSVAQTMRGASLWQVASKVRPADATMQQTMVAIHEENPESFIRGNMNLLKKGQLLRIPSAEVIQGISGSAAVNRVAKHERALRARKSVKLSKRLSPEIIALAAKPAQAETPSQQAAAATPPEAGSGGRLRLDSATDAINKGAFGGDLESGKSGLPTDTAEGDDNRALKSRVALLEEQLRVAHKLIKMKGELAQLQLLYRQIDTQGSQADDDQMEVTDEQLLLLADAGSVAAEEIVVEEPDQEPLSADDVDTKNETLAVGNPEQQRTSEASDASEDVDSSTSDTELSAVAVDDVDPVAGEKTPAEDVASSLPTAEEEQSASSTSATEVVASSEESITPTTENLHGDAVVVHDEKPESFIEGIENNLLLTAGGVGVLGLLLAFLLGRRGGKKSTGVDTALSGEIPLDVSLTEKRLAGESSGVVKNGEVEGARELAAADDTRIQQPDVESTRHFEPPEVLSIEEPLALDPLELVKVLMRNGDNQQAQKVLMQAVDADPARMELHMQLIELLHANKDRHAFEAEMNQLETSGFNIEAEDWQKIERMHADLLPAGVGSPDVVKQKHTEAEIIDLDIAAVEESNDEDEAGSGSQSDSDLEEALRAFEMVLEDKKSEGLLPEAGIALDETAILDSPVIHAMPGSEIAEDLELEEDFVVDESAAADQEIDVISLDDSFGIDSHISSDFDDVFTASVNQGEAQSDISLPAEEEILPIAESEDLSVSSFDADPSTLKRAELDAKIDLAAAFADMGDIDGAKDILDEVMSEGSERQQQAVREMLKKYL